MPLSFPEFAKFAGSSPEMLLQTRDKWVDEALGPYDSLEMDIRSQIRPM